MKIPDNYEALKAPITVDPDEVEEAFVKANPGLSRSGVAVTCDSSRLSEVRICMSKDLKFRDCAEIDRRACRRDKLIMPPVRGGELIRRTQPPVTRQHRLQLRAQRTELLQRAGVVDPGHGLHRIVAEPVHVAVEFAQRTLERRRAPGVEARMPAGVKCGCDGEPAPHDPIVPLSRRRRLSSPPAK